MSNWLPLTPQDPKLLHTTIRMLHHAAQFIASTGEALLAHQADDSHTNMTWLVDTEALAGHLIQGKYRLSLVYPAFSLVLLQAETPLARLPIAGNTQKQVFDWLQSTFTNLGLAGDSIAPLSRYDIPPLETTRGGAFTLPAPAIVKELARRRNNAHDFFVSLASGYKYASTVRTWPHHFDLGVYLPIQKDQDQETVKAIGLGMAIPDHTVNDLYFYVNHWSKTPIPRPGALPPLQGNGHWVTKDWTGAVLPLSEVTALAQPENQQDIVYTFFDSAIQASLQLIGEA